MTGIQHANCAVGCPNPLLPQAPPGATAQCAEDRPARQSSREVVPPAPKRRPQRLHRRPHKRNFVFARQPHDNLQHTRVDVGVHVGVQMRRLQPGRQKPFHLRAQLGRNRRLQTPAEREFGAQQRQAFGQRAITGCEAPDFLRPRDRAASNEAKMNAHAEFRMTFCLLDSRLNVRPRNHQAGACQNPVGVSALNSRVDGRIKPEVVRIDNQQSHKE